MLQPNKFKIYNASAGSGKTYTLVKEFLSLLLVKPEPDAFKELLAITFTNKAANEMKERIIEKLQELSTADEDASELVAFADELSLEPAIVRQRSAKILTTILHQYGLFAVSTIDKFNLRLMRAFSQDLGLSVNFDVEMDTVQLLSDSVNLLFSELKDDQLLTQIMADIAIDNLNFDQQWDITGDMVAQAKNLFQDRHLDQLNALQKVSLEDFNKFRQRVNQNYFQALKLIEQTTEEFLRYVAEQGLTHDDFKGKQRLGVLNFFYKIKSGNYTTFTNTQQKYIEEDTILSNPVVDEALLKTKILEAYEVIQKGIVTFNFWKHIKNKVNPLTVINEIEKKLNHVKEENNILLINEFNKIIGDNIKDQPAPFIYEKIGNKYKHYFIDEFQDTSDLQWNNLLPLMQNAFAQDQTVMIVGDPKQSIYRWRGGNPNLMLSLAQNEDDRIEVENLPINWRSHQTVIAFNNDLYTHISDSIMHPGYQELYHSSSQKTNHKEGGFVQIRIEDRPKKGSGISLIDVCMERMLTDIQFAEAQGFPWEEMAILVRNNRDAKRIAEFLAQNDYQVLSSESLLLKNSDDVNLLVSFIQYLANPSNIESRMQLLLNLHHSQRLNVTDITQFTLSVLRTTEQEFVEKLHQAGIELTYLHHPFQSFYDQVASAIRSFGFDQETNAYVVFFMDEILKFQYQHDPTAQAFIAYWEQKKDDLSIVIPEGQKAIQLLTVHKSKGLQFPVVFLPYAIWKAKPDGIWVPLDDDKINSFYVDGITSKVALPEEISTLITEEEIKSELDILNLLYVATTRAVEQLYITTYATDKDDPVASYINRFAKAQDNYENGMATFGEPIRISAPKTTHNSNQITVPYINGDWSQKIQISREHTLLWNDSRSEAIAYGNKMHAVLEQVNHISDTDDILDKLELQGQINADEKAKIAQELFTLFQHPKLKAVLEAETFYNERDFIGKSGNIFRPDRLVKLNNDWILIDYKTGEETKGHHSQLQQYAADLDALGYPIKQKYLVYLDQTNGVVEVT